MFDLVARVFGGRRKVEITMYVSTVTASRNTILHRNSHRIRTEIFYRDERSVETTQILATVGTAPKQWYTQEAFLRYHGAAEELRGFM